MSINHLFETIELIYNNLEDNLSQSIFENCLLYALTGKQSFIQNIVSSSHKDAYKDCLTVANSFFSKTAGDIIYYGAGYIGRGMLCIYDRIKVFCDRDVVKTSNTFCGHMVISPEDLINGYKNCIVIITIIDINTSNKIIENLISQGFNKDNIYHYTDVFNLKTPYLSDLMAEQYFDPEIILPRLSENEVFIDAGCCNCYTDFQFVRSCNGKYSKILAFEPSPKQYKECLQKSQDIRDITVYQNGLWNENTDLYFDDSRTIGGTHITNNIDANSTLIKAVRLDSVLRGDAATFIKMDIEGAELNALKGAEQTILKHRPKLAICVYHKPEDIIEIPAYILSLHNDYKLYLRHYSFWHGETVLYAV